MFMFFVNKPISSIFYLIGLAYVFVLAIKGPVEPFLSIMGGLVGFTTCYFIFLIRYYILSGRDTIFLNINISKFKHILDLFLFLNVSALISSYIFVFKIGAAAPLLLFFYSGISFIILEKIIFYKFISEGVKHNINIKNLKLDDIYQDFRTVMLAKLIESNSEEEEEDSEEYEENIKQEKIFKRKIK